MSSEIFHFVHYDEVRGFFDRCSYKKNSMKKI